MGARYRLHEPLAARAGVVLVNDNRIVLPGLKHREVDEAKVVALRKAGLTLKDLAVRMGVGRPRIVQILRRHGLGGRRVEGQ